MTASTQKQHKRLVRTELRAIRRAMSDEARAAASSRILREVMQLPELLRAGTVHVYLSLPDEVDTAPIISALMAMGVDIVVPWMEPDGSMHSVRLLPEDVPHIAMGPRGVPAAPRDRAVESGCWDVVLVPLVGVDTTGNRLGNAAGHYDRLLGRHRRPAVALAFDGQVVEQIPVEDHDVPMDVVVTQSGVWRRPVPPSEQRPAG